MTLASSASWPSTPTSVAESPSSKRTPDTTPEVLDELGKLLSEHIRYEERTVFGRIEAILTPEELDAVGSHLQTAGSNEHLPPRARADRRCRANPTGSLTSADH